MEPFSDTTNNKGNDGKMLGITGLVLGIFSLTFAFIPCIGLWACIPAIAGIVLSAISLRLTIKAGMNKNNALAGLICSIIAFLASAYWMYVTFFILYGSSQMLWDAQQQLHTSGVLDSLDKAIQQEITIIDTVNTN